MPAARPTPLTGTSPPRPDGLPKADGSAEFADDAPIPGLWYGATVRSAFPRASIREVRWDAARAPAGAVCVTARDLPGPNGVRLLDASWPILASTEIRHVGEPVALVAARTRDDARLARDHAVAVLCDPHRPVLSWEEAAAQPPLHTLDFETGDVDAALANAAHVIEGEYRTGYQEHVYLECQGMTAWWSAEGVTVLGTMQCPYYVHKALAHAFGLPDDRIRVRVSAVGGGFGGKEDYPSMLAVHAALLARAAAAPVRIVYDRHEDIIGTTKRHPSLVRHRTAVDGEGRLHAMDIELLLDGGAYLTLSSVVLSRAALHTSGPYRCPNVRVRGRVLRTDTPPNGAFRGFGVPQVTFALERQMDAIARRLGLDPYEIRARNVALAGDRLPTGQVLADDASARACLDAVVERTRFRERWQACEAARRSGEEGVPQRGVGLSLYFHGNGFTGNGERQMRTAVTARLMSDGRIEVLSSAADMGQGAAIVLAQLAADAGGLALDDIVLSTPDTAIVPDSGPTVASRTTMIVGHTAGLSVRDLVTRIVEWWSASHGGTVEGPAGGIIRRPVDGDLAFREIARRYAEAGLPAEASRDHEPPSSQVFDEKTYTGSAYRNYSWAADVVEVEIDPDTFDVRPIRATVVCDVGVAVHPALCAGQIEGGSLQALGYGLMEEIGVADGRYLNDRLSTYIVPTIQDAPVMDVQFLQTAAAGAGPKGVGELPMDGGAPAVAAAIENATGFHSAVLPVTPERLLALASGHR